MARATRRAGQHPAPAMTGRRGFTLTELLVVIGIAIILLGISISIGKSLRAGNRLLTCKAQMQQIHQALAMYYMDEHGVPPFYIAEDQDPNADAPTGPGLMALYDTGFLHRELTLHCPADVYVSSDDPMFLRSYQRKWDEVGGETELNKYSYLPFRGVTLSTDPNYRRQLMPGAGAPTPVPYVDPDWHPADDTVVTWCGYHKDSVTINGDGVYLVLFWDGSVDKVCACLMEAGTPGNEAWKVTHDDASG